MSLAVAKVFMSGRSQAVRLPKAFRFATDEVYVSRRADKVVLSPKPRGFSSAAEVRAWLDSVHCPDFPADRPNNGAPQKRELF
jgi:antitoxin VapB